MTMNKVQFQSGMSLRTFLKRYGTEAQCETACSTHAGPMALSARVARQPRPRNSSVAATGMGSAWPAAWPEQD